MPQLNHIEEKIDSKSNEHTLHTFGSSGVVVSTTCVVVVTIVDVSTSLVVVSAAIVLVISLGGVVISEEMVAKISWKKLVRNTL